MFVSSVHEGDGRLRLCDDIAIGEARGNEDMLTAVMQEWGSEGSFATASSRQEGLPPGLAQARGALRHSGRVHRD